MKYLYTYMCSVYWLHICRNYHSLLAQYLNKQQNVVVIVPFFRFMYVYIFLITQYQRFVVCMTLWVEYLTEITTNVFRRMSELERCLFGRMSAYAVECLLQRLQGSLRIWCISNYCKYNYYRKTFLNFYLETPLHHRTWNIFHIITHIVPLWVTILFHWLSHQLFVQWLFRFDFFFV